MIRSMTAFARAEAQSAAGTLCWEVRSVNHRYLEPGIRLPEDFRALETRIREMVGNKLGRGKVDCNLRLRESGQSTSSVRVDESVAQAVIRSAHTVSGLMDAPAAINPMDILRWPGVVETQAENLGEVHQQALSVLAEALDALVAAREAEGARLGEMLSTRCEALQVQVALVKERRPRVLEGFRARLEGRLVEFKEQLDPGRVEQEMVLLAQKLDVDEELDRLESHLIETRDVLQRDEPIGRRLDFLMQEFNREANTLGSKSMDSETTQSSVEMKVLIEQMREQVQNIE